MLRLFLWLFDALALRLGGWLAGVVGGATGADLGPSQSITVQLPRSLTVDTPWVRTSFGVFQRVVDAGLYGVFLLALVASAGGGLLGFTTEEAKSVTGLTVLVWYANRRALELVGYLLDLANTAAAQFADVSQMLPGFAALNGLQQGSANGANAILLGLFGIGMAVVRWMTLFGVNALIVALPLAGLLAVCWPTRWLFTVWWRALAGLVSMATEKMLLANSSGRDDDQVAVGASRAKAERRVVERGTPASQAAMRTKFSAAPMKVWPNAVLATPR